MEEENTYEENKKSAATKFQSPLPFILQFRDLIFGTRSPDLITKITFYLNLVIWAMFMLWNIISAYTISSRKFIYEVKHIPVEYIINKRGEELGFTNGEFIDKLSTVSLSGIILWGIVFVGLVLMFRKMKIFIYFFAIPILIYVLLLIFYISPSYFMQDTTTFDKVMLFVMLVTGIVFYYLIKNRAYDEDLNFFAIEDDL